MNGSAGAVQAKAVPHPKDPKVAEKAATNWVHFLAEAFFAGSATFSDILANDNPREFKHF